MFKIDELTLLLEQCNIDEDLMLTTAQLMKSLGLQVYLIFLFTKFDSVANEILRLQDTTMSILTIATQNATVAQTGTLSQMSCFYMNREIASYLFNHLRQSSFQRRDETPN